MTLGRTIAAACALVLLAGACSGGSGDDGDGAEISQEAIDAALGEDDADIERVGSDGDDEAEPAAADTSGEEGETVDDAGADDELEVTEVEEDPLDNLMNSLNQFNACLDERGYELDGFPGDGSGRELEDFDSEYLAALGACNTESGIADAATDFGAAQSNRTPEEIAQTNFGLPIFKDCLEDLGWTVGELTPGADGALGFGATGTELTPPGGGDFGDFNTDDINACRREAEDYTEANFDASQDS